MLEKHLLRDPLPSLLTFVGMVRPSNGTVAAALAIVVSAGLTFPFFLTKGKTVSRCGLNRPMYL